MQNLIKLFKEFSAFEHASENAKKALEFLTDFCRKRGAKIAVDSAGNLLATIGEAKVCLQAHYDMVSIGDHPPKIVIENDWIRAANGALGADNGIAVAAMLDLIEREVAGEYLFTNDEEIGLLGASKLEVIPKSKYIINLDGENDSEIIVGCAGGAEYYLNKKIKYELIKDAKNYKPFKISAKNCAGGHSGVDIHKDIENAILKVVELAKTHGATVSMIAGGERINSIAKHCEAIVLIPAKKSVKSFDEISKNPLYNFTEMSPLESVDFNVIAEDEKLLDILTIAPHGVFSFDGEKHIVSQSNNFAKISVKNGELNIVFFARANSRYLMQKIDQKIRAFASVCGFEISEKNRYAAWENKDNFLVEKISDLMRKIGQKPKINIMHAGLECGVLKNKSPQAEIVSIGMQIESPHSANERVYIPSIEKFHKLLNEITQEFN
ncbi:MAG: M20/M25/M40 family metallo-hydrolase [Helicobacteraceae bacterium]|jgi:dipeptidase D|nr:M20/M25/M40 family metallo-hydrolase [Helicobacteraceae bacterium]